MENRKSVGEEDSYGTPLKMFHEPTSKTDYTVTPKETDCQLAD